MTRLEPYYVTELARSSAECDYCEEGAELEEPHAHALYVSREGASHRTADELAELFILETAALIRASLEESEPAPYKVPAWIAELELEGWCEDPDDAQGLSDEIPAAESALYAAGFYAYWDDGYVIGRLLEPCAVCETLCYHVTEEHADYWRALEDDDALSYVPRLHDHAPASELESAETSREDVGR